MKGGDYMNSQTVCTKKEDMHEFLDMILKMSREEFLLVKGVATGLELNRPPKVEDDEAEIS